MSTPTTPGKQGFAATERIEAPAGGPGRGPMGGGMVGQKAMSFGPSARRLVGRMRPERALASLVVALVVVSVLLILGLSYAMSRAAVFTITSERVVMRFGAAIRKYVNVPYSKMTGAQLKRKGLRVGDISMQLEGKEPAYLHLWPFVRPFKYSKPQPMMRGIKEPEEVAQILARAVFEHAPDKVRMELASGAKATSADLSPNTSVPAI